MNKQIFVLGMALLSFGFIAGCQDQPADNNKMTAQAPTDTELAAYAASHPYPQTQPADSLKVAAIASPDRSTIKLYNFSNDSLPMVDVWVNGSYVQHVRGLPANGSIVVRSADLYNAFGKNFAGQSDPITRVQLQTVDGFFTVWGPIAQ